MPSLRQLQSAFTSFKRLIAESRISARQPLEMAVEVSCRDGRGRIVHTRARCLDISDRGACIVYREAVTLPAVMQLKSESDGVVRTGQVRHCTPRGSEFEIGIEFCDPATLLADKEKAAPTFGSAARKA